MMDKIKCLVYVYDLVGDIDAELYGPMDIKDALAMKEEYEDSLCKVSIIGCMGYVENGQND